MIGLLLLTVLAVAYANGANDNFKATATIYGSETLGYRGALALATVAQLLGSVACVFVAARLVRAFGGQGLVPEATVADPVFLVAVGVGAAATVLLATRLGLPVSTTHALIGGLVGAGLAAAPASIEWSNLTGRFMLPLLISPLLSVLIAGGLYPVLSRLRRRLGVDEVTCLCIARTTERVDTAADGTFVLGRTGIALSVEEVAQCRQRYDGTVLGLSAQTICDRLHEVSGFALGFARGLNDTPKVLGLLVAATWSGLDPRVSLAVIAVAMAAGGLLHSRRIAQTMGKRITEMNRGQGFVANAVASILVIWASLLGTPVSTTHVSTGAIFGISLWTGKARGRVVGVILIAWLVTLPVAAGVGYLTAKGLG